MDFNSADQQFGDLIPKDTICPLHMHIKPGGGGDQGYLTASKNSDAQYLSVEYTVTEGPFAKRKIFENIVVSGGKLNEKNESIAANISRAKLRAILESARGILPTDTGPKATAARQVESWRDFEGMTFLAKIGIEPGKDGYNDKNKITLIITPDKKEYIGFSGSAQPQTQQYTPPPQQPQQSVTPSWARG